MLNPSSASMLSITLISSNGSNGGGTYDFRVVRLNVVVRISSSSSPMSSFGFLDDDDDLLGFNDDFSKTGESGKWIRLERDKYLLMIVRSVNSIIGILEVFLLGFWIGSVSESSSAEMITRFFESGKFDLANLDGVVLKSIEVVLILVGETGFLVDGEDRVSKSMGSSVLCLVIFFFDSSALLVMVDFGGNT